MKNLKRKNRRFIAAFMAVLLLSTTLLPSISRAYKLDGSDENKDNGWDRPAQAPSWTAEIEAKGRSEKFEPTGLAFNIAHTEAVKAGAEAITRWQARDGAWPLLHAQPYLTVRPGHETSAEYQDLDGAKLFCVANHAGATAIPVGNQMYAMNHGDSYSFEENKQPDYTKFGTPGFNFTFMCIAIARANMSRLTPPTAVDDYYEDADAENYGYAYNLLAQAIAWIATDKGQPYCGWTGDLKKDWRRWHSPEWAIRRSHLLLGFEPDLSPRIFAALNTPATNADLGAYRDIAEKNGIQVDCQADCMWLSLWVTADIAYSFRWNRTYSNRMLINKNMALFSQVQEKDGMYYVELDQNIYKNFILFYESSNCLEFVPYGDWQEVLPRQSGKIVYQSPTGQISESGTIGSLKYVQADNVLISTTFFNLNDVKLYDFTTYMTGTDGTAGFKKNQTMFTAVIDTQAEMPIIVEEVPPITEHEKGKFEVNVDRYKHEETWNSTYTVNLRKYDSETGKALEGSHWDILESFDASQLEKTDLDRTPDNPGKFVSTKGSLTGDNGDSVSGSYSGDTGVNLSDATKYNWANDSGSQFETWDDPHEDPCVNDDNVTDEDGLLYEIDSSGKIDESSPAHKDIYTYTYTKGYCGGHPAPEIEEAELTGDEEEDEEIEAENEQLREDAWAAWEEEVDKCEKLAAEGGFFHAIDEGAAQAAMEADRDEFFKQFISLKYDYSAEEIESAKGYILHGTHNDDILIETRTVTSSEFKDTEMGTKLEHGDAGSESEPGSGEEESGGGSEGETGGSDGSDEPEETSIRRSVLNAESQEETGSNAISVSTVRVKKGISNQDEEKEAEIRDDSISDSDGFDVEAVETASNAQKETASEDESLVSKTKTVWTGFINAIANLFSVNDDEDGSDDEDEPGTGGTGGTGGHLRDTETFKPSEAQVITPPADDIVDWTFIVYDHRTEGEIHFNKKDFDFDKSEDFDSYGIANGDGSLEGAVYGLFAAQDIIHPDTSGDGANEYDTGVVYKQGDLVAVTTTDRNGDGSFMVFTEAPGMTYDYKTGKIVETGDGWASEAPENLYMGEDESAAKENDMESFIGHNPDNSEITAGNGKDLSDTGGTADEYTETTFKKYSSNQGYEDTTSEPTSGYYPISDNKSNNGNCWIGRPLIIGPSGTQYMIKELSRSEGYELSVYGKDGTLTTNRETFVSGKEEFSSGTVELSKITRNTGIQGVSFTVSSSGTNNGYTLQLRNIPKGASLNVTTMEEYWDETLTHKEKTETQVPVMATPGTVVTLGGTQYKASVGDTISYAGKTFTVNNVYTIKNADRSAKPSNTKKILNPNLDAAGITASADPIKDINSALYKLGYRTPAEGSPWVVLQVNDHTIQSYADAINDSIFKDSWYSVFNEIKIVDSFDNGGRSYIAVAYSYRDSSVNSSLYNDANDMIYVRTSTTYVSDSGDVEGYFYATYSRSEWKDVVTNEQGFVTSAIVPNEYAEGVVTYLRGNIKTELTLERKQDETYWAYADGEQMLNDDGSYRYRVEETWRDVAPTLTYRTNYQEVELDSFVEDGDGYGTYTYVIPQDFIDEYGPSFTFTILFEDTDIEIDGSIEDASRYAERNGVISYFLPVISTDSYTETVTLSYPGKETVMESGNTLSTPVQVFERPIRQQLLITKDIQILPETKEVWYCSFCGHENEDDVEVCAGCKRERSVEETKTISYAHDTYSAVHSDNLSTEKKTIYESVLDWLTSLLTGKEISDSSTHVPDFRFKTYLKSNLERLYRDEAGNVVWVDRNGNVLKPEYADTNLDGNYDTFTWTKTDQVSDETSVIDFPEKQTENEQSLYASNVQKIYTQVKHLADSTTTGDISNTTWADYDTPQGGDRNEVGSLTAYSTSQDGQNGVAASINDSLYSYDGKNVNTAVTDRLNAEQNDGYTRVLESTVNTIEDGAGKTREVSTYNYKKFFDAVYTANTDKWDNDMFALDENYPGQHWFETFYERYQMDDTDQDFTLPNADAMDSDGTAGGDRDTSFKPFRWIREKLFGDSFESKSEYPSVHDNPNKENEINTSAIAHENAEASDAVRQFAIDWYLKDEVAKLVINNGYDEDQAKNLQIQGTDIIVDEFAGPIDYSEQIYDIALYNALAKSVNYLKPFYDNDLDTIYSVEWDTEKYGGSDADYTTLSIDKLSTDKESYYNVSAYLPYGTYVIVEQQPTRIDGTINDFETKNYKTDIPKEIILPAVYEENTVSDTFDSYEKDYFYDSSDTPEVLAEKYMIRFNEEWTENHTDDLRCYVIRSHNNDGDFEVYKYGLETDKLTGSIDYSGGSYDYKGYEITQDTLEPLKDYYNPIHRVADEEITAADGANEGSNYFADDINKGIQTANGGSYAEDANEIRYHYGSISENTGSADNVLFPNGTDTDDNNPSGFYFKDNVNTITGNQTAYEGKFASMLVPWSVLTPADVDSYDGAGFTGYADMGFRNTFYVTKLRIEKLDSETGENILHDDAVFALYAASRYTSQDEVDEAIANGAPATTKIGDVKFFLEDTQITGSYEFLKAMKADNIQQKRRIFGNDPNIFSGIVKAGTPVCMEEERIMLYDEEGSRFGDMTVYTTDNDVYMLDEDKEDKSYNLQNTGYFVTPQPVGAGVYVLAEIKPPTGYVRTNPIAIEVYSDNVSYYVDGDMYSHVNATVYHDNLIK